MTDGISNRTHSQEVSDFNFKDGTTLPTVKLSYLDLNTHSSKTALVITCFRGRLQSNLNFVTGALKNHRIIVVALFGNGESSSPSNEPAFPRSISYEDCVRAQKRLLEFHLEISSLDVVLGFSMGGQCTYYWSLMYPDFMQNAIIICSSARTSRHNYQFLEGPKAALQNSLDYNSESPAKSSTEPSHGVHAFGKAYSAWLTSAQWFDQELYKSLGFASLQEWDHDTTLMKYAGWQPNDLLSMRHMWQEGNVTDLFDSDSGSLSATLSRIKARVLLIPCETDQYFRPDASQREAQCIPKASLDVMPSVWGHLAGSGANKEDVNWMDQRVTDFLQSSE